MLSELLWSPAIPVSLAVICGGKLIHWLWELRQLHKQLTDIAQEEELSLLLGSLHKFPDPKDSLAMLNYVEGWMSKSPRMFLCWITPLRPVVFVYHSDLAKIVMQASDPKPMSFGDVFATIKPWIGESILTTNGGRWQRQRHLLTPAFHFDILRPYVDVYSKAADIMLEKIGEFADKGESFDVYELLKLCTLDIILKCSMSLDLDVQNKKEALPYVKSCDRLALLWGERIQNVAYFWDALYKLLPAGREFMRHCDLVHKFAEDVITKRQQILKEEGPPQKRYADFVDILLTAKDESGRGLSTEEIRAEVDTFLFAGHETSSTSTSWLFYSLAQNPQCQLQAQREVDQVLKDRDNVQWSDLGSLEYVACCMKEALRLYPPAPGIMRQLTNDTVLDGLRVPAGTRVCVHLYLQHRNALLFPDPEKFLPERFNKEESLGRSPFAHVPFAAGSRNCIGQHFATNEIKTLTAKVLQRFNLRLDPDHPVRMNAGAILHSETGVWLFADRRDRKS